ncbi:WXG100 family type VII secretion target [Streptomyces sp. NPDC017673]|uniref:WXG100 family type VII secretion target n=1 Tax=unclassified Streptomyces TaxID=2593676 RepID=UPI0037B19208
MTYSVDRSNVDTIVGEMSAITSQLLSTLEQLDNQTAIHLSQWTSEAQEVYTQVKAQWDGAAAHMAQLANTATTTLGHINAAYTSGEQQGMRMWGA